MVNRLPPLPILGPIQVIQDEKPPQLGERFLSDLIENKKSYNKHRDTQLERSRSTQRLKILEETRSPSRAKVRKEEDYEKDDPPVNVPVKITAKMLTDTPTFELDKEKRNDKRDRSFNRIDDNKSKRALSALKLRAEVREQLINEKRKNTKGSPEDNVEKDETPKILTHGMFNKRITAQDLLNISDAPPPPIPPQLNRTVSRGRYPTQKRITKEELSNFSQNLRLPSKLRKVIHDDNVTEEIKIVQDDNKDIKNEDDEYEWEFYDAEEEA
jgi:hypothetical protein